MKIVVLLASLLVIVLSKEDLEGLEQYLQDPKFWHFVEKRLGSKSELESKAPESPSNLKDQYDPFRTGSSNDVSKLKPPYDPFETHSSNDISDKSPDHRPDPMEDPLGNLCQYRPNASMIIRSKASLNNGAFFLKSFVKRNREECVNACCDTPRCNLVVYEEKVGMDQDEHNCYLFNCGTPSKCLFAEHANYTSLFFPNHVAPSTSYVGHQQQHENELEDLNSNVAPKPTTRAPRRKVPLYGNCDIDWNDECSDKNAECRDSICKCSYGYHAQYGICRVDCPDNAFECKNKGQGGSVPECISKNHVCDGTPQCADGSDEDSCVNTDNDQDWTDNNANEKNIPPVIDETPTPKATQKPTPKPPQITTRAPGIKEIKNKDPGQTSKEKSAPGGDNPEKNTDKKQQASSEKSKDTLTLKTNSTESKVPDSSGLLEEAVETHVVVESPTDSHQGPIVALALGLGITVILLFFVGCRLRNVKRRIRKGRALHSNEADYLINGMYL